jgi:RNA-directed DNA polymerase
MHSYTISKHLVYAAWLKVKANGGVGGADNVSLNMFESNLQNELYKLWNRMSSGSYMAPPVKRVEIAKADGKMRPLGIPTVADRVAQMVVKMTLEPEWDCKFHSSSYGYRPQRSAHHAVQAAKQNCWKYTWAIDLDIKGFFDNLSHEHLLKFVASATENAWCKLYIKRWLTAGVMMPEGQLQDADKGTPQGGVISPLLANLYLHKVFDSWMQKYFPNNPFERYADDVIVHCQTQRDAEQLLHCIAERMQRFNLTLHPEKTKIVSCGQKNLARTIPQSFDFLGFTFRRRTARRKDGKLFPSFQPAVSSKAKKSIVKTMREWNIRRYSRFSIVTLSKALNPQIRGWLNYYGAFYKSALSDIRKAIQHRLYRWVKCKYPEKRTSRTRAYTWLDQIRKTRPQLFAHWYL